MTILTMVRDASGAVTFGLPFSDTGFQTTLAQNVVQTYTIPLASNAIYNKYLAVFSFDPGLRVFVANGATAAVPGGAFATTVTELNPTARLVLGGDILSFITPDTAAYVNVKLLSINI